MQATPNSSSDVTAELNVTPLIDVMLVLLVFLLITLPLQTHVVQINPVAAPNGPPPVANEIGVQFDGTITWNGQPVSREQLDRRLADAASREPWNDVHLNVDRLARYDIVAKVMADAQRLGETHIAIVNTNQFVH